MNWLARALVSNLDGTVLHFSVLCNPVLGAEKKLIYFHPHSYKTCHVVWCTLPCDAMGNHSGEAGQAH
jgi:hypothetical protein